MILNTHTNDKLAMNCVKCRPLEANSLKFSNEKEIKQNELEAEIQASKWSWPKHERTTQL